MIILPPEEKKSSPIAKWIFRILVAVVVLLGMGLFALNILSGTSDAHRHGLEQALSDTFRHKIQISRLNAFNIFPQFFIEMEGMQGEGATGQNIFLAEKARIAFTFTDLLQKKGTFEDIHIENLRLDPGVLGQQKLEIATAKIVPATESAPARLTIEGDYGGSSFSGFIELTSVPDRSRPAYRLGMDNNLELHLGLFRLKGKLRKNDDGFPTIRDARLELDGQDIAAGQIMLKPVDNEFAIHVEFRTGQSEGTVIHVPAQDRQDWIFKTLAFDDVVADHPVWAKVGKAWHDVLRPGSAQAGEESKTISIVIHKLTGLISGVNLEGRFIAEPGQTLGWWQGVLTAIPDHDKISGPGQVECGLVKLVPKGDIWTSDLFLTRLNSSLLESRVSIHEYTGKINFQVDRVVENGALIDADLQPFVQYKNQLKIGAGCSKFPGLASP